MLSRKSYTSAFLQMWMDLGPAVYCGDFERHYLQRAAEFYQVSNILASGTYNILFMHSRLA